jgi:chaperone modulatory protein CbpM
MDSEDFRARADLDADILKAWIEAGWLTPASLEGIGYFSEVDLAKSALIKDLQDDFGINSDGIAVVLHLIDQVYGLRLALAVLISALSARPTDLRLRIASDVRTALDERTQPRSPETKPASGNSRADMGPRCRERRFT